LKIIDKNKDYYDYLSHVYGIDENIAFNRRGSTILTTEYIQQFIENTNNSFYSFWLDLLILETGFVHYLFDIKTQEKGDKIFSLIHTYTDEIHFSKNPVCIYFNDDFDFRSEDRQLRGWKKRDLSYSKLRLKESMIKVWRNNNKPICIELPILDKTFFPSVIKPEKIWQNIYNYLVKINEPNIIDTRDDVSKAIDHGFDKRTSFRNIKNKRP
jgi:hypothetical protein